MSSQHSDDMLEEAAKWWLRRHDAEPSVRDEFSRWLEADLRHGLAFDAIEKAWDSTIGDVDIPAPEDAQVEILADQRQKRRQPLAGTVTRRAIAGGLVAAGAAAIFAWSTVNKGRTYEFMTRTGETRQETLADGSSIELDANSHLRVHLTNGVRRLELIKGRALFEVAKDKQRPFIVVVGGQTVTALGTVFSVEYRDAATSVTLFSGHVRADRIKPAGPAIDMVPGDNLALAPGEEPLLIHKVDLRQAAAWRQGRLHFENEPLSRAVERMNDYSDLKIIIGDARTGALRISGTYESGQTQIFLDALRDYYGLSIERKGEAVIIRSPS